MAVVSILEFEGLAEGMDFQPAFRAALDQLRDEGGGELVIPMRPDTDTYWIGRREFNSGLDFAGVTWPIKIRGEGRGSRIGMLPSIDDSGSPVNSSDFNLFFFRQTNGPISLENLSLFGNKDGFAQVGVSHPEAPQNDQTHIVQIEHARDISFTNVWIEEAWGSGIKLGNKRSEEGESDTIHIMGCHFLHNRRQNLLIREGARRVWITNNYFDGGAAGSQIHFEPSGGPPEEIIIAHNHIRNRILVDGEWVPNGTNSAINLSNGHKLTVIGNHMEGGGIFGKNVQEAAIIGNHIDDGASPNPGIDILGEVRDVSIIGNWIRVNAPRPAIRLRNSVEVVVIGGIRVVVSEAPENVIIANNQHLEGNTGVNVVGNCRRIKIHDNMIFENSHGGGAGINIDADTREFDGINIHDNYVKGFKYGVQLARTPGSGTIKRVRIRSNDIEGFTDAAYEGVPVDPPDPSIEIKEFLDLITDLGV